MTLTLDRAPAPAPQPLRAGPAELVVHRRDIMWRNVTPGVVLITVRVRNVGSERSEPTTLTLRSAPFGAFVRWTPLDRRPVPGIDPGGSVSIRTFATAPPPRLGGSADDVPPTGRRTTLDLADDEAARWRTRKRGMLARDPYALMGARSTHWVGNLNVFIGGHAVERHRAQALRVYPGRRNKALFFCGEEPDQYRFQMKEGAAGWDAELIARHDLLARLKRLLRRRLGDSDEEPEAPRDTVIEEGAWIELEGRGVVELCLTPPEGATHGHLDVHVHQRSTGNDAVVEFSLDAGAAGPGCYVV